MRDEHLVKEAEAGDVDSQFELGIRYSIDNHEESKKWFEKAAENGSVDAMVELAGLCESDETPDTESAIKWYLRAAEKGSFAAMVGLIRCYNDRAEIEKWITKAEKVVSNLDAESIFYFANTLGDYPEKAMKWYAISSKRGCEWAKLKLELISLTKEFDSNKTDSLLIQIIVKTIALCLEIPEKRISMDTTFDSDLGADNLDMFELIYSLEEALGIQIPDDESLGENDIDDESWYNFKIKTVKELVSVVKRYVS